VVDLAGRKTWLCPVLSNGEKTFADQVEESGGRQYGGQAVRLMDIPADAGAGFGVFENLHGLLETHGGNAAAAGAAFAEWIRDRALQYHGTAARHFIAKLQEIGAAAALAFISEKRAAFAAALPADASGLVRRGSKLFSLTAAAGELAIHLGVLPWKPGAAAAAAARLFNDWLQENGNGNPEERAALGGVSYFLESNLNNFRRWNEPELGEDKARNISRQVGYLSEDETIFYILPETFQKEACKGFRHEFVLKQLETHGALLTSPGRRQYQLRPPKAKKPLLVYAVKFPALEKSLLTVHTLYTTNQKLSNHLPSSCKQSVSSLYAVGETVSSVSSDGKNCIQSNLNKNNAVSSVCTVSSEKSAGGNFSRTEFAEEFTL
jgi:uncharacterized protein (DUF927 family)